MRSCLPPQGRSAYKSVSSTSSPMSFLLSACQRGKKDQTARDEVSRKVLRHCAAGSATSIDASEQNVKNKHWTPLTLPYNSQITVKPRRLTKSLKSFDSAYSFFFFSTSKKHSSEISGALTLPTYQIFSLREKWWNPIASWRAPCLNLR